MTFIFLWHFLFTLKRYSICWTLLETCLIITKMITVRKMFKLKTWNGPMHKLFFLSLSHKYITLFPFTDGKYVSQNYVRHSAKNWRSLNFRIIWCLFETIRQKSSNNNIWMDIWKKTFPAFIYLFISLLVQN